MRYRAITTIPIIVVFLVPIFHLSLYKRQNKLFHFHKTFCSEFDIINTKQNVHFNKVVSPITSFVYLCISLA